MNLKEENKTFLPQLTLSISQPPHYCATKTMKHYWQGENKNGEREMEERRDEFFYFTPCL
jgi:hypothetical protein